MYVVVGRGLKVWIRKELDGLKGRMCIVDAKVLIALALHCVGLVVFVIRWDL